MLIGIGLCVDMIKRRNLRTRSIKLLVLDEADEMLNKGELVLSCLCCCFCNMFPSGFSSCQQQQQAVCTALKLVQQDVSLLKVCIVSNGMSRIQQIQNLHPSKQVANSDKNKIVDALTCLLRKGAISLSHGALDIVDSAVTSWQTWQQKKDNCRSGRKSSL